MKQTNHISQSQYPTMSKVESSSVYDFALGGVPSTKDQVLNAGAATIQSFAPVKSICAHLNAFHVYASDTSRTVEANHYCTHLSANVRQCLIYDSPKNPAKLSQGNCTMRCQKRRRSYGTAMTMRFEIKTWNGIMECLLTDLGSFRDAHNAQSISSRGDLGDRRNS